MEMQVSPMRRFCELLCKIEDSELLSKSLNEEKFHSILQNLSKWNKLHCQATDGKAKTFGWSAVLAPLAMLSSPFLPKGISEGVSQIAKDGFFTNMFTTFRQKEETKFSAHTQLDEKDWNRTAQQKQSSTDMLRKVQEAFNSIGAIYNRI